MSILLDIFLLQGYDCSLNLYRSDSFIIFNSELFVLKKIVYLFYYSYFISLITKCTSFRVFLSSCIEPIYNPQTLRTRISFFSPSIKPFYFDLSI